MPEQQQQKNDLPTKNPKTGMKYQALRIYDRILDVIVTVLIFVMLLTLTGSVVGLMVDFYSAANAMHRLALGLAHH